eukprot:scaffold149152_cov13-Tisochrysis_lutea.AAC.2
METPVRHAPALQSPPPSHCRRPLRSYSPHVHLWWRRQCEAPKCCLRRALPRPLWTEPAPPPSQTPPTQRACQRGAASGGALPSPPRWPTHTAQLDAAAHAPPPPSLPQLPPHSPRAPHHAAHRQHCRYCTLAAAGLRHQRWWPCCWSAAGARLLALEKPMPNAAPAPSLP